EQVVVAASNEAGISYRGGSGGNANVSTAYARIPESVQPGDGLIMVLTFNSAEHEMTTPPAGWTQVDDQKVGTATSVLWKRVAQAGDAGKQVDIGLSGYTKADIRLLAYAGTNTSDPIAKVAKGNDSSAVTEHTSPTASVDSAGSWAVTYWGDKSSRTTEWTAPAGVTPRGTGIGSGAVSSRGDTSPRTTGWGRPAGGTTPGTATGRGGGRLAGVVVESGEAVGTGTYGGKKATTDAASRAAMWTIPLARQ